MSELTPRYTIWEGLNVAIHLGIRALEEIRALARIPGPAGRDGLSLEDMTLDYDGHRTVTFRFQRGDVTSESRIKFPMCIDSGVWKEATQYETGDGVTWGGSFWIAQKDTNNDKPDSGNGNWRLAVKRGRDGKNGAPPQPPRGPIKVG